MKAATLWLAFLTKAFALLEVDETEVKSQKCSIITKGVCLPGNYDKYRIPQRPLNVKVEIKVEQVTSVNDVELTIEFAGFIVFIWQEDRLIFSNESLNHGIGTRWITLNLD